MNVVIGRRNIWLAALLILVFSYTGCQRNQNTRRPGNTAPAPVAPVYAVNTITAVQGSINDYLALAGDIIAASAIDAFSDAVNVSDWALDGVRWNVGSGIVGGYAGKLNPRDNITRAETATIVLRLLQMAELVDVRTQN